VRFEAAPGWSRLELPQRQLPFSDRTGVAVRGCLDEEDSFRRRCRHSPSHPRMSVRDRRGCEGTRRERRVPPGDEVITGLIAWLAGRDLPENATTRLSARGRTLALRAHRATPLARRATRTRPRHELTRATIAPASHSASHSRPEAGDYDVYPREIDEVPLRAPRSRRGRGRRVAGGEAGRLRYATAKGEQFGGARQLTRLIPPCGAAHLPKGTVRTAGVPMLRRAPCAQFR
jgi:hypothetical protein